MNSPGQKVPNMLLEKSGEITPERMKRQSPNKQTNKQKKKHLDVDVTVMEVNSDALKNNAA